MLFSRFLKIPLLYWLIIIFIIIISNCYQEHFLQVTKPKIKIFNFNTKWCGWSRKFQVEWNKLVNIISADPSLAHIETYDIKCDNKQNESMCEKYKVSGYPYVVIEYNDKQIPYNGNRTSNDLLATLKML